VKSLETIRVKIRDVNTGFSANWISVVENWFETGFQFY